MGAANFMVTTKGANAREAFRQAVNDAQYERGHGGYTGTIAEKDNFVMITPPIVPAPNADPKEVVREMIRYAEGLIAAEDPRVDDKWGPAGCIEYLPGHFLFFGWASS